MLALGQKNHDTQLHSSCSLGRALVSRVNIKPKHHNYHYYYYFFYYTTTTTTTTSTTTTYRSSRFITVLLGPLVTSGGRTGPSWIHRFWCGGGRGGKWGWWVWVACFWLSPFLAFMLSLYLFFCPPVARRPIKSCEYKNCFGRRELDISLSLFIQERKYSTSQYNTSGPVSAKTLIFSGFLSFDERKRMEMLKG